MAKRSKKLGHDPLSSRPRGLAWMAPPQDPQIVEEAQPSEVAEETPKVVEANHPEKPATTRKRGRKRQVAGGSRNKQTDLAALEAVPRLAGGKAVENSARRGLPTGYKRHTFILPETLIRQVKTIAFVQERPIKEVVEEALQMFVDERQSGGISGLSET